MKILIGCEESQVVCIAFRMMGHEAYSCDLIPTSGNHPEWHLQMDVFEAIKLKQWDMLIAFPPCTYLSYAGNSVWNKEGRKELRHQAEIFFFRLWECGIPKICLENPRGIICKILRESQQINPFNFGTPERKRTLLWLKNLPPLIYGAQCIVKPNKTVIRKSNKHGQAGKPYNYYFKQGKKSRESSKTFPCIAKAMAEQWGNI